MTNSDWVVPVASFLIGAGTTTVVWWVWGRMRSDRSADRSIAEAPENDPQRRGPGALDVAPDVPKAERAGNLRTSQRVILHLAFQPRLAYGDVAPVSVTQAGMSHALDVAQPALARVLGRLIDGDAVLEMRTHVAGQPRRLKVYQLTVHGEAIARDLRGRGADPSNLGRHATIIARPEHDPSRMPPPNER